MLEVLQLEKRPEDDQLTQKEIILTWFLKHPEMELMKHEVNRTIVPWVLRGSVARALRELVKDGWLEKVDSNRKTDFGIYGHVWKLRDKFQQELVD